MNRIYKQYWKKIMRNCRNIALDLVGDGRSDSPGFNAKYGTYTLMNSKTNLSKNGKYRVNYFIRKI